MNNKYTFGEFLYFSGILVTVFFIMGLGIGTDIGINKGSFSVKVEAVKTGHAKWEINNMGERTFVWEPSSS